MPTECLIYVINLYIKLYLGKNSNVPYISWFLILPVAIPTYISTHTYAQMCVVAPCLQMSLQLIPVDKYIQQQ